MSAVITWTVNEDPLTTRKKITHFSGLLLNLFDASQRFRGSCGQGSGAQMQLPAGDSHIKDKRAIIPYGIQAIKKNTGREEK